MYPIIFQYKSLTISSYGLMLMLAFLTCNYLLKKYLRSIDIDARIGDDIIFYAAIGGIVGAKIYYIIEYWSVEGHANILGFINILKGLITLNINLFFEGINQFGSGLVFLGGFLGGCSTGCSEDSIVNIFWIVSSSILNKKSKNFTIFLTR